MDKYRSIKDIPLATARVSHLLERLSGTYSTGTYNTQEELVRAYADIAYQIIKGFDKRVYDIPKPQRGTLPSRQNINLFLLGIYSEILYLMSAVKGTSKMAEGNFNFGVASIRDLQAKVKHCRQLLSTFALYVTQFENTLHFGETFSTETNIDRGTELLNEKECFIDLLEGNITLPVIGEPETVKIKEIKVGEQSNGYLGNNTEANTPVRGSLVSMHDGNVDTWTEYEKVVTQEDLDGLKLELKVILDKVSVINNINIKPVFLGARTPLSIETIETSEDGRTWKTLKNDISVADFLDEDPESRFHLSPSSSRGAGEFNITFSPRVIKFIKIAITQSSAFNIYDVNENRKLRYAIGIKEISVSSYKYGSVGELISKQISFNKNISALGVQSLIDPPFLLPEVGGAEYYISYDDGASWLQITTLEDASNIIPEILYPAESISKIRYKVRLFKDEQAFITENREKTAKQMVEVFSWSIKRPFNLNLLHTPVEGSLSICDPEVAIRGKNYPRINIGSGTFSSLIEDSTNTFRRHGNTQLKVRIPLDDIKDPSTFYLQVNGIQFSRISSTSLFSSKWSTEYVLERNINDDTWEAVFGNGDPDSPLGRVPGAGDVISLFLSEEYSTVEGLSPPYKIKLDYPSDGIKNNTIIKAYHNAYSSPSVTLPTNKKEIKLPHENIMVGVTWEGIIKHVSVVTKTLAGSVVSTADSSNSSVPGTGSFRTYKTFVDGHTELSSPGDWTIDSKKGILYLNNKTEPNREYTVFYWWEDIYVLDDSSWDFIEGKLDEINIYESGYKTRDYNKTISNASNTTAAGDLSFDITIASENVKGIVTKSVRFQGGIIGGYKAFEIPFIDGRTEFEVRAKVQDEEVSTVSSGADSIAKWRVTHWQNVIPSASISFSDTFTFSTEKSNLASVTSVGDYYFSTSGSDIGYVYVHRGGVGVSITSGITLSYQYTDEYAEERMKGSFSVDSKNGIIYLSQPLIASDLARGIRLKYTPYRIKYNISKELKKDKEYELDVKNKLVTILPDAKEGKGDKLLVRYKYYPEEKNNINLGQYFTPILRALNIKVS